LALYFFETSALVKRYAQERGTSWVQTITDPQAQHRLYISDITGVEAIAAIKKKERDGVKSGGISQTDAANAIKQFRYDFANQYKIVEVTSTIISIAMDLPEKHKLRAYDAVQLAVALEIDSQIKAMIGATAISAIAATIPTLTVVSADDELNTAAIAEGLILEDPKNHP
jgi:predicted nucleic acid-binding protein